MSHKSESCTLLLAPKFRQPKKVPNKPKFATFFLQKTILGTSRKLARRPNPTQKTSLGSCMTIKAPN